MSGSEPPLYVLYTSPEDAGMFYNGDGESKLGLGAPNPAHEFRIDPTLVRPRCARACPAVSCMRMR